MGCRSHMKGSSLIEVLITMLVIAIGIMGLGAMQLRTMANNQWQLQQSTASLLSYQIFERMRTNRGPATTGAYNRVGAGAGSCPTAASGNIQARNDVAAWLESLQAQLGEEACGSITCNNEGTCQVDITWDDEASAGDQMPTSISATGAI